MRQQQACTVVQTSVESILIRFHQAPWPLLILASLLLEQCRQFNANTRGGVRIGFKLYWHTASADRARDNTSGMATETLRLRFDDLALHSPQQLQQLSELQDGLSVSDLYR